MNETLPTGQTERIYQQALLNLQALEEEKALEPREKLLLEVERLEKDFLEASKVKKLTLPLTISFIGSFLLTIHVEADLAGDRMFAILILMVVDIFLGCSALVTRDAHYDLKKDLEAKIGELAQLDFNTSLEKRKTSVMEMNKGKKPMRLAADGELPGTEEDERQIEPISEPPNTTKTQIADWSK